MKHEVPMAVTDRRGWIKSVVRIGVLGGIATMVTYLVGRQLSSGCPLLTSNCTSCQLLSRCELPLARSARETHADKEQA